MASAQLDVVFPEELEYFVQSLRRFPVAAVGSKLWIDCHEMVIKLSQQAIMEASSSREEAVKEYLVLHLKLKVLVHEAFCILVWKIKILPKLLEIEPNPPATFLLYTVLFHEGAVISLLETALFHQNGCESLEESAIDLVDYCAQAIVQLIGLVSMGHHSNTSNVDVDESTISELERQKRDLLYKIGIRCISILNYLADSLDKVSLSTAKRMVTVHDIPCLLSEILHFKPWLRRTSSGFEHLIDEKWTPVEGENLHKVTKAEAQTWFCFRQLITHPTIMEFYELNDYRRQELSKCQGLLNDTILDQLPPLAEFKHLLCTLTMAGSKNQNKNKQSLLLEEVSEIKENLLKEADEYGGFMKIAMEQADIFLTSEQDEIFSLAKRLNSVYNTDLLAEMEEKLPSEEDLNDKSEHKCGSCKAEAQKKCSNCMSVYYCSRECQVENWPTHKQFCLKPGEGTSV